MQPSNKSIANVILKVASRCNINCSYCYVYNKGDSTWQQRPGIMPDEIFEAALDRISRHCRLTGQDSIGISFHGGEPCLIGVRQFDAWCTRLQDVLGDTTNVSLGIQTNGTLLSRDWVEVFQKHQVDVGISMDGPRDVHDLFRLDHHGNGSYDQVERGLKLLQDGEIPHGLLVVIPLGADPLTVHHHFLSLGCTTITYLLPHFTHETVAPMRERYGATPCADFLIPIFDDWWFEGTLDIRIRDLWNMARVILGGHSEIETLGRTPPLYAFIESDGEIEGLDSLRVCREGIAKIGLNVKNSDFNEILLASSLHAEAIFEGMPLPTLCRSCVEKDNCGGGYLPHRYSNARGFDNPSVWCADLLKIFAHLRDRLGVPVEETQQRRQTLHEIAFAQEPGIPEGTFARSYVADREQGV